MLDLKHLRDAPDDARDRLGRKGVAAQKIDDILALDEERRAHVVRQDALNQERNERSKSIGRLIKEGGDVEAAKAEVRRIGDEVKAVEDRLRAVDADLHERLSWLPNYPHPDAPVGREDANRIVREWGAKPSQDFAPLPHKELGERLGIFDFERAAKLSGSGFSLLMGRGAALQRGIIRWLIDLHVREHGYTEVAPPYLVTSERLFGTGQLPKLAEDMYKTSGGGEGAEGGEAGHDLWLIPTGEVPVTNLFADEILAPGAIPARYVTFTPCFRREAGSHGKDTTGLQRMHQFDKVELVRFSAPERSETEHEELLANAEECLRRLGLHYRIVELATQDMSFAAHRCWDLEVWAPGTGRYLEVSSCSNFLDFQARRANIRYRPEAGAKPVFVHTLNASGLALPRLMIALLETYQQADGTIALPEELHAAVGFDKIG